MAQQQGTAKTASARRSTPTAANTRRQQTAAIPQVPTLPDDIKTASVEDLLKALPRLPRTGGAGRRTDARRVYDATYDAAVAELKRRLALLVQLEQENKGLKADLGGAFTRVSELEGLLQVKVTDLDALQRKLQDEEQKRSNQARDHELTMARTQQAILSLVEVLALVNTKPRKITLNVTQGCVVSLSFVLGRGTEVTVDTCGCLIRATCGRADVDPVVVSSGTLSSDAKCKLRGLFSYDRGIRLNNDGPDEGVVAVALGALAASQVVVDKPDVRSLLRTKGGTLPSQLDPTGRSTIRYNPEQRRQESYLDESFDGTGFPDKGSNRLGGTLPSARNLEGFGGLHHESMG